MKVQTGSVPYWFEDFWQSCFPPEYLGQHTDVRSIHVTGRSGSVSIPLPAHKKTPASIQPKTGELYQGFSSATRPSALAKCFGGPAALRPRVTPGLLLSE